MTNESINKTMLLDRISMEQGFWETLLDEVGEARMLQRGATGYYTFKDVVAHLTGWRQRTLAFLEAARRQQPPTPPPWPAFLDEETETEQINQWLYETNRERPLADVLRESRRQFEQMAALVEALSDVDLFAPNRFAWMNGKPLGPTVLENSFSHLHQEHEPALRAWLDQLAQNKDEAG